MPEIWSKHGKHLTNWRIERQQNNKIHELKDEAGEIIDEKPDTFNKYFVELGEKLAANIPQSHISPESFLNDVYYPENGLPSFKQISKKMFWNCYTA